MGNGVVELLALIDQLITQLQAETHPTIWGPTGPPINAGAYAGIQAQLAAIKE